MTEHRGERKQGRSQFFARDRRRRRRIQPQATTDELESSYEQTVSNLLASPMKVRDVAIVSGPAEDGLPAEMGS